MKAARPVRPPLVPAQEAIFGCLDHADRLLYSVLKTTAMVESISRVCEMADGDVASREDMHAIFVGLTGVIEDLSERIQKVQSLCGEAIDLNNGTVKP